MKIWNKFAILATASLVSSAIYAKSQVEHQVHVAGPDTPVLCEEGDSSCDKNFSLTAIVMSDGSVKGQYVDRFAGESKGFSAQIDCVSINDNKAWLSGIIKNGDYAGIEDSIGRRVATFVADNGKNNEAPFDQISFSYLVNDNFDCFSQPDWPLMDMPKGQVNIK